MGRIVVLAGLVVILNGLAWWLAHPVLFSIRPWLTPMLIAAGVIGLLAVWRLRSPMAPAWRAILGTGFGLAAGLAALVPVSARLDRAAVLGASGDEARIIGPHVMAGYADAATIRPLVERGLIGGLFITRRNLGPGGAAGLREEIAGLQQLRRSRGLPPLIVATDQEGGIVSRLSPPLAAMPALSSLADLAPPDRARAAQAYGERQGRDLARLGVTMDFSPVVDLRVKHPANPFDVHSHIADRAISDDPLVVTDVARAYVRGLAAAGVTGTLKHFPGFGGVEADTHLFAARLTTPLAQLDASDWVPFKTLLAETGAALMVGHANVEALDPDHPASQSSRVVRDLIRSRWGSQAVVVTDDITMGAAFNMGLCRAVTDGLGGGVDMLLIAYDTDQVWPALRCAIEAQRNGRFDTASLAASAVRLGRMAAGNTAAQRAGLNP